MTAAIVYKVRQNQLPDGRFYVEMLDKDENVRHFYFSSEPTIGPTITATYPAVERAVDEGLVKHVIELLDSNGKVCHRSRGINREFAIIGLREFGFAVSD